MKLKQWFALIAFLSLLSACSPSQPSTFTPGGINVTMVPPGSELPQSVYAPASGDRSKLRGQVFVDSISMQVQDSFPQSYFLGVKGSLPTPCHELREVVEQPTDEGTINIQLYSVFDPYTACSQTLQPFETSIPLGRYVRGSYTVFVNSKEVGKIVP